MTTGNTALDTVSGIIRFADINIEDRPTVTAQFNSFVYRSAQQNVIITSSLTLEQLAAITAVQVPLSVVPDSANTNIGEATWTYRVPDHALDFLAEGETLTLTYMARVDTNYSLYNTVVYKPFTITITGANDLPTAAATGSGIIELDGTNNPEIDHAGGVITFADVDLTDRPTVTAPFANYVYTSANGSPLTLTPAQRASLEATLTLTPAASNTNNGSVAWSYDVADANFDFIAAGETLTLTYIAIIDDHHGGVVSVPLTLTVTVNGTNDIPTITATSGGFIELVGTTNNTDPDHAGGTITFTDVDLTDRPVISAPFSGYTYTAANGTTALTLTQPQQNALAIALALTPSPTNANNGSVTWSYDLADAKFDFLAVGETLTLTYTATVNDGHGGVVSTPITVTVTGTNDVPSVAVSDLTGGVIEVVTPAGNLTDTGTIAFTDVDLTDGHVINPAIVASSGALGVLTANVTTDTTGSGLGGVVTWNYSVPASAVEYLAENQIKVEQFTITLNDGHGGTVSRTIEVTVTGTNDYPVVATSDLAGTVLEAITPAGNLTDTGTIAFNDVDLTDNHVINPGIMISSGALGTLTASVTTDTTGSGLGGVVTWNYSVPASAVEYLAENQVKVERFTIQLNDGHGGTISRTIEVTITGTNDAPIVVTSDLTGTVLEAAAPAGNLTDTGTIAFTDVDLTDTHVINPTIVPSSGALGVLSAGVTTDTAGSGLGGLVTWNYSVAASAVEYLAKDQIKVEQFTITLDDGNGGTINRIIEVTITGTNDDPVVTTSDLTGTVLEAVTPAGNLADTGTITFTDVDLTDAHVINPTIVASTGALGVLTASVTTDSTGSGLGGVVTWNYSVAASAVEYLAKDQTRVEQFTITLDDGNGGTIDRIIEVTITGTNDDPVVAAALTASADEGDTAFITDLLAGATDIDLGETATLSIDNLLYAVDGGAASAILPAGFSLGIDGHTLTIDPADPAFDYLALGEQTVIVVSYDVRDAQGATVAQSETVTITGTNDVPVVAAALTAAADEADTAFTADLLAGATDLDLGETATLSIANLLYSVDGDPGSAIMPAGFSLGIDGHSLTIDPADPAFDYLAFGQQTVIEVSYDVRDAQGVTVPQTETITITGTHDAVTIDTIAPLYLAEQTDTTPFSETIPVTFTDADLTDVGHTAAITHVTASGAMGSFAAVDDPALISLMTTGLVNKAPGSASGSLDLDFTAASTVFDYLEDTEVVTLAYTLEIDDQHGGLTTHTAYVHINGVSDLVI